MYYDLLFDSVWITLRSFGYSHYGVENGAVAVLHTWGQNLSLHPHIHCIVPAAGYTLDGRWKNIGHSDKYLYPVHQLSSAFKGKFLDSLKRALRKQNELSLFYQRVQQAYKTNWVVYCEPSMASAEHVIKYLGQYTHRVAITNRLKPMLNALKGSQVLTRAFARCAKPDRWLPSWNYHASAPRPGLFLINRCKKYNNHPVFAQASATGKGMPANEQKLPKTVGF